MVKSRNAERKMVVAKAATLAALLERTGMFEVTDKFKAIELHGKP